MNAKKIITTALCLCLTAQMCGYIQPVFTAKADGYSCALPIEQVVQNQVYENLMYKNLGSYIQITALSTTAEGVINVPAEIDGLPVKVIDDHGLAGNSKVTKIHLPDTVTTIGIGAFYGDTALVTVDIPEGVTQIKSETFINCKSLEFIMLPSTVRTIGERAFWGCDNLCRVNIPPSVKSIEAQAFEGCKRLTSINLPATITAIEDFTFYGCDGMTEMVIPDSVESMGVNAVPSSLKKLTIWNVNCELNDFAIPSKDTEIITGSNGGKVKEFCLEHGYTVYTMGTGGAKDDPIYDINHDGYLNVADAVSLQNWLLGNDTLPENSNPDINNDGYIDSFDLVLLKKEIIKDVIVPPASGSLVNLTADIQSKEQTGLSADETFINAQTEFSLELFKNSINDEENVLISPYSVMQALSMTGNGADGTTRSEMEKTLGGIDFETLNKYLYTQRTTQPNNDKCKLLTANSVWSRDDDDRIQVKQDFLQNAVDYYGAEVFKAPFDETTVGDINGWVDKNTDHMINKVINEISDDIVMYLINAVTFDAKWADPYNEYQVRDYNFTAYDGNTQNAEMMFSEEHCYISDENAEGFIKYYQDGRYAFAGILPNEDITVTEYVNNLTAESLHDMLANPDKTKIVDTGLPKFSYDYQKELKGVLSDMGMPTAFTRYADFSRLADTASGTLFIDYVLHKTFIEVGEQGTRAGAVTVIGVSGATAIMPEYKKKVILDRPFVYCILDTETSLPVFMGTLMSVE